MIPGLEEEMGNDNLKKAIVWGLIGGLVGTIIMDLVIVGFFYVVGMPVGLIYSFIGDVAGSFFSRIGIKLSGGVLLGALVHFFLGLGLGGLFGALVTRINAFKLNSLKKGLLLGIIYIEIASQPILVTAPLLVEMTGPDILQWYGLSTFMHLIYGLILGGMMRYGARS
jgi:hypothetical protein